MTSTALDLPGWRHVYSGKVRDLYVPADDRQTSDPDDRQTSDADDAGSTRASTDGAMLIVASDRVSAFDHVLEPGIHGKGAVLTQLSAWWFDQLAVPDHRAVDTEELPPVPADVSDRAMIVRSLDMFPIECVVRGYLSGSGWKEYQATQSVCGVALPSGLSDGDRLPAPIYTPAYKAPLGEHDENITFERTVELVGQEAAEALRDLSLSVYSRAAAVAESRGVILADTKFEFGRDASGRTVLADEVLTSDSSRYWDAAEYAAGRRGVSFDKQIVRDWLAANWDGSGVPPRLPHEIVERTAARYRELFELLTATPAPRG
ncbi:phosphoribosylaminoimidazolesuccinocarboxamide synthase [Humibacter sp. BT305]|nr:phosphoribosylaminoimidazolesuccinocarboxamide synthase [Humibacter sp. BT305]